MNTLICVKLIRFFVGLTMDFVIQWSILGKVFPLSLSAGKLSIFMSELFVAQIKSSFFTVINI